jgi:hypothetical protein
MVRRVDEDTAQEERQGDTLTVPNFQARQRAELEVHLMARELGITPAQLRSLRLAYGKDMVRIRAAAERLRRR